MIFSVTQVKKWINCWRLLEFLKLSWSISTPSNFIYPLIPHRCFAPPQVWCSLSCPISLAAPRSLIILWEASTARGGPQTILPVAAESWAPPSWWNPLLSWASSMTLKNAPWWWNALAQMLRTQQMNHPGWRKPDPSVTLSALPTSSWKPLVSGFSGCVSKWGQPRSAVVEQNLCHRWHPPFSPNYPLLLPWFFLCMKKLQLDISNCFFEGGGSYFPPFSNPSIKLSFAEDLLQLIPTSPHLLCIHTLGGVREEDSKARGAVCTLLNVLLLRLSRGCCFPSRREREWEKNTGKQHKAKREREKERERDRGWLQCSQHNERGFRRDNKKRKGRTQEERK